MAADPLAPKELIALIVRVRAALDGDQTDPQALADLDEDLETVTERLSAARVCAKCGRRLDSENECRGGCSQ